MSVKVIGAAVLLVVAALAQTSDASEAWPVLRGPYLGQKPPGRSPEIFAPGIVSTGLYTRDITITPDGREIYFGVVLGANALATVLVTREAPSGWTEPEVASFAADPAWSTIEPCLSTDGQRMLFVSNRRQAGQDPQKDNWDIWVVERRGASWTEARNLGAPINTAAGEYFPSLTRDGTLYFTRDLPDGSDAIFRCRWKDGRFSEPERLPEAVNSGRSQFNAFIAPDESYIVVSVFGRQDSLGSTDYYVVFRGSDDTWSQPLNLGEAINTAKGEEYSPYVSPDGRYFFFMSPRRRPDLFAPGERLTWERVRRLHDTPGHGNPGIWWVNAGFLQALRPKAVQ
jgi:hypothetical protein